MRRAEEFLTTYAGQEILLIAPTRPAADELVREVCTRTNGVFGVHRFTLPQLGFLLAAERLAQEGKSFLTGVAMDAMAARAVQACRTNGELHWFDHVATTPGFFRALAATINELRLNNIDSEALRTAGPSGADLASLLDHFDEKLENTEVADMAAAYRTALKVIAEPGYRFAGRPLLLLDITPTSLLEQQMVDALSKSASAVLSTTQTRETSAAPTSERALDRLRAYIFQPTARAGEIDSSMEFISATDEGRECVEIARAILSLARSGTPFDHMAVVLRNPDVYQPCIEDAMRRAEVPAFFSVGSRRPNTAGRAMLALLACASEDLSASRFSEYLSLGQTPKTPTPPRPQWIPIQGELFPGIQPTEVVEAETDEPVLRTPHQWERLLVDAAVIGGHDRWVRRLDGLANEFRKQIAEVAGEEEAVRQHLERQLDRLANLRSFALPIIEVLDRLPSRATWDEWLDALDELATQAIRQPEFVLSVLTELRPMGSLGPITLEEVREVLSHRLTFLRTDSPDRRYGKVFITTTAELLGLEFDVVFLPGLAEDNFPKKAFEDPLLLDDARQAISPWLLTQPTRIARERELLHIAAWAAKSKLWISYPRMDLGQGRARNPSFYAVDVLRAITGKAPTLGQLQRQSTAQTQSQIGWPAPRDPATAIDDAEYDLAVISGLLRMPREEVTGRARYLLTANASLERSLRARATRWRSKWTDSDGVVASDSTVVEALAAHRPSARAYSATALQHFAACPYRFVLSAIHRIRPREETVAIERIDALTRGSLFHSTQFRLLTELRTLKLLPITAENLGAVTSVADRLFDEIAEKYCEELAPAIPRIWESQIEDIRWDLRGWLRAMSEPENAGWTPRWFELSFGLPFTTEERDPDSRRDAVDLGGGVRVRGAIDMVEEKEGMIRITDHKTGRALARPPGLTGSGEVLQPALYAQAAEALLGKPASSARLFYCTERGGYQSFEIPINEHSRDALSSVINLIDQSIVEGFLPAAPREDACRYCDYRPVCGPYEETRIRRKTTDRLHLLQDLRATP